MVDYRSRDAETKLKGRLGGTHGTTGEDCVEPVVRGGIVRETIFVIVRCNNRPLRSGDISRRRLPRDVLGRVKPVEVIGSIAGVARTAHAAIRHVDFCTVRPAFLAQAGG